MRPLKQDPWSYDNITKANPAPAELGPTRVIHIPPDITDTVYLKDTSDREVRSYAALSYCWGGEERNKLKTTRATLTERQRGIEYRQLPKTLQDAITVARDLGLLYLWIDALCIIQDDDHDKATEIARMSQVYRGASLTISASRAAHCDEGFLHKRDLEAQYLDVYQLTWREGSQQSHSQNVFCSELPYYYCEIDPIDARAWTMQEHRLARRLLRFGSGQLAWRCEQRKYIEVDGGVLARRRPIITTGVFTTK
ncbi:HET-domain-containing protein [Apiospora kogelbergensis]|uniref:HET-domain-containing protein n=1 Tax=Apiospora kogelbergensis TaxID=1337665 RepID=A0AAW0QG91_9PEZI